MKVRFLCAGRRATTHPWEPQFSHEEGEVVDLASVTRSPAELAADLISWGRAEAVETGQDSGGSPETGSEGQVQASAQGESSGEPEGQPEKPRGRRKRQEPILD